MLIELDNFGICLFSYWRKVKLNSKEMIVGKGYLQTTLYDTTFMDLLSPCETSFFCN